jgi:hypothetical protein
MRETIKAILSSIVLTPFIAGCASAPIEDGCPSVALSASRVREIAIAELQRRGGTFVEANWETRVTREKCENRFFAQARPAYPGGHFGVTVDDAGNVVRFSPGY